jgi:2-oxoglutarate ferredoxin oxidoreductase subunit alpha
VINSLYIVADDLEDVVLERYQRYQEIEAKETKAEGYLTEDADILLVAYGASARIVRSAVNSARAEGIKVGMLRPISLWPFPVKEIQAAAKNAKELLVVEMSMGQMVHDVKLAINCEKPVHFFGHTGGVIPTPAEVLNQIKAIQGGVNA